VKLAQLQKSTYTRFYCRRATRCVERKGPALPGCRPGVESVRVKVVEWGGDINLNYIVVYRRRVSWCCNVFLSPGPLTFLYHEIERN
jgi:hypothetical protein